MSEPGHWRREQRGVGWPQPAAAAGGRQVPIAEKRSRRPGGGLVAAGLGAAAFGAMVGTFAVVFGTDESWSRAANIAQCAVIAVYGVHMAALALWRRAHPPRIGPDAARPDRADRAVADTAILLVAAVYVVAVAAAVVRLVRPSYAIKDVGPIVFWLVFATGIGLETLSLQLVRWRKSDTSGPGVPDATSGLMRWGVAVVQRLERRAGRAR